MQAKTSNSAACTLHESTIEKSEACVQYDVKKDVTTEMSMINRRRNRSGEVAWVLKCNDTLLKVTGSPGVKSSSRTSGQAVERTLME